VILASLHRWDRELSDLSEASKKPYCQFPIHYDEGELMLTPHGPQLRSIIAILRVRCAARLSIGDNEEAARDVEFAERIANLPNQKPFYINYPSSVSRRYGVTHMIWEGLADHRWNDNQLRKFQDLFASRAPRFGLRESLRGRRALAVQTLDRFARDPKSFNTYLFQPDVVPAPNLSPSNILSYPVGWIRQNEVATVRFFDGMTNTVDRWSRGAIPTSKLNEGELSLTSLRGPILYTLIAKIILKSEYSDLTWSDRLEAVSRMGVIACALERSRLATGRYPESLANLTPTYLAEVPLDPCVVKPFHYQPTDDGWYRLYSVGPDGKDDDGGADGYDEKGDWAWPDPSKAQDRLF
jgi:hypothetical protein